MSVDSLILQTKDNCNISDANYWGFFSICNLLLRLRDLYFQEQSMEPWDRVDHGVISSWISEREKLWETLEDSELRPIRLQDTDYDPFDLQGINGQLEGTGLLYGAGYGLLKKPNFFVSRIQRSSVEDGVRIFLLNEDVCRDLSPPFAFRQEDRIYVRINIFTGYLFQKYLELGSGNRLSYLRAGFEQYGLKGGEKEPFDRLKELASDLSRLLIWHEISEASRDLDDRVWSRAISESEDRLTEFRLRAVGDMLADASPGGTMERLLESNHPGYRSFYLALMDDIRKQMFPDVMDFAQKVESGPAAARELIRSIYNRARTLADQVLSLSFDATDTEKKVRELTRAWVPAR